MPKSMQPWYLRFIEGAEGDDTGGGSAEPAGETNETSAEDEPANEPEVNWQEKFEAQRKINRDLEKKVKAEAGTLKEENEQLRAKLEGREKEFEQTKAQREAEAKALQKANERILQAEIRAQGSGKLADPSDALLHLDMSSFEVGDDGEVDREAIGEALGDLIKQKPYLAAEGGKRFQAGADQGVREESRPSQLTKSDLEGMTVDEINAARAEGRLDDLLGKK